MANMGLSDTICEKKVSIAVALFLKQVKERLIVTTLWLQPRNDVFSRPAWFSKMPTNCCNPVQKWKGLFQCRQQGQPCPHVPSLWLRVKKEDLEEARAMVRSPKHSQGAVGDATTRTLHDFIMTWRKTCCIRMGAPAIM